jgi:hypothetical protein
MPPTTRRDRVMKRHLGVMVATTSDATDYDGLGLKSKELRPVFGTTVRSQPFGSAASRKNASSQLAFNAAALDTLHLHTTGTAIVPQRRMPLHLEDMIQSQPPTRRGRMKRKKTENLGG